MAVRLTADLCAQAIVASCKVYGTDPVQTVLAKRSARAPLVPAALAVQKVTGAMRVTIMHLFGVANTSLLRDEREPSPMSSRAQAAAWLAMDVPEEPDLSAHVASPAPVVRIPTRPAAPVVTKPAVDHTAAIKAALERRRDRGNSVVGVDADKANLKAGQGGCHWHLKAPAGAQNDLPCHDDVVPGRLFCPHHCRAVGQKDTPVVLDAPVLPASYRDPRAANAVGRKAAT